MQKPIYLDYNATTPVDPQVLDAMLPWFSEKFGNAASRSHLYGWEAEEAVQIAREQIAKSINAKPNEVIFTSGATESINLALKGTIKSNLKSHIITSKTEHKAVLDVCEYLNNSNDLTFLNVDKFGNINLNELESVIKPDSELISLMLANNETGNLLSLDNVNEILENKNIIFHLDATQAMGKIKINVKNSTVDLMSISAHKIYGPKGIGALYVKSGIALEPQIHGGSHQKGLRSGTLNVPLIIGFGKACELAVENLENYQFKTAKLRDKLENSLLQLSDVKINGDINNRLANTSNLSFGGVDGELLLQKMNKIAVSSGSACTSASVEPSHVLLAMGVPVDLAYASIRFSLGISTTENDIEMATEHIKQVILEMRK